MGNSASNRITAQDRAVLDLKLQRDKLKQYQRKIQGVLDREQAIAKQALLQANKAKALTALRQRKYQESLLSKTDGQLETLQNLVSSIEFSLVEKDVLFGLKQGNAVLKELHKEMSLEAVEKLMNETAEAVAYQKEIDSVLISKMSVDEEEQVQRELAALQAEQPQLASTMPAVPETQLPERLREGPAAQEEEDEPAVLATERQRVAIPA